MVSLYEEGNRLKKSPRSHSYRNGCIIITRTLGCNAVPYYQGRQSASRPLDWPEAGKLRLRIATQDHTELAGLNSVAQVGEGDIMASPHLSN